MSHIAKSHYGGRDLAEIMEMTRGWGNTRLLIEAAINHEGGAIILVADLNQKSYVLQFIRDMVGKNHQVEVMTLEEAPQKLRGIQRKPVMIDMHPAAAASEGALGEMYQAKDDLLRAKQDAATLSIKLHKADDKIMQQMSTIAWLRDALKRVDDALQEMTFRVIKARILLSPKMKKPRGIGRKVLRLLGGPF
jgi:hypothetical protein